MPEETEPKKVEKTIPVVRQKTFCFAGTQDAKQNDTEVNNWIQEQTIKKQPPFLGKVCCNHDTGDIIYVYMFTEQVKVMVPKEVKK